MNELVVADKASEWLRLKALVLDSISSPITRRVYNLGLDEFIAWYTEEPRPGFTKATVSAWRVALEARKLGPISINVRLTAVRKLAVEAADNGLLAPALAAGIARIKGVRAQGIRTGNWLSLKQAQALLSAPDITTTKGLRDRAILAVLLGCGLRRSEVAALTFEHVQQRDGRWCITLVSKYSDHLPLYRQSAILLRDAGVSISRATMDGWVMTVGELLVPVAAAMGRELVAGGYIQADETPVPVQMHDKSGKNHQAYLWQYGRPGGSVVFDFQMGRGREGPKNFIGLFAGILQTDGYIAYDHIGGDGMVHAACWSHSRRKVFDAVKLNRDDLVATQLVSRIDELFAIDAKARDAGIDHAARHVLRQEYSRPLVAVIKKEMETAQAAALPASALGKAISYTLSLWHKLTRFLEYPELELSNNLAENSMRGVALGRKNWIHVGSEFAGPRVAAILSVIESCRRLKLPVREYLASILPGLANLPIQRVAQCTPAAWAASRI